MRNPGLPARAKLFRGLGDPSRLRGLEALSDGPLRAGEVVLRAGLGQPNASMHPACLAEGGRVTWERQGRVVHCALADRGVARLLDQAEELLLRIGPLIEACPRYRRADLARPARRRRRP
jgi:DNA-binding transcriptional ArsR family regulator